MPRLPSDQPRVSYYPQGTLSGTAGQGVGKGKHISNVHLKGHVTHCLSFAGCWGFSHLPPHQPCPSGVSSCLLCPSRLMPPLSAPTLPNRTVTSCSQKQVFVFLGIPCNTNSKPDIPKLSTELAPEKSRVLSEPSFALSHCSVDSMDSVQYVRTFPSGDRTLCQLLPIGWISDYWCVGSWFREVMRGGSGDFKDWP